MRDRSDTIVGSDRLIHNLRSLRGVHSGGIKSGGSMIARREERANSQLPAFSRGPDHIETSEPGNLGNNVVQSATQDRAKKPTPILRTCDEMFQA